MSEKKNLKSTTEISTLANRNQIPTNSKMKTQEKINPKLLDIMNFIIKVELEPMKYLSTERWDYKKPEDMPIHWIYKGNDLYCKAHLTLFFVNGNNENLYFDTNDEAQEYFDTFFNDKK